MRKHVLTPCTGRTQLVHPAIQQRRRIWQKDLKKRSLSLVYVTTYFLLGVLIRTLRAKSDS